MLIYASLALIWFAYVSKTYSLQNISRWPLPVVHNLDKDIAPHLLENFQNFPHISVSLRHDGALESLRRVIDLAKREGKTTYFGASTVRTERQVSDIR